MSPEIKPLPGAPSAAPALQPSKEDLKHLLAMYEYISPADLRALSSDPDEQTRMLVAERGGLPGDVLHKLAVDVSDVVRAQALRNPDSGATAFRAALLGQTFSARAFDVLCSSTFAVADLNVFELLWARKSKRGTLLSRFSEAVRKNRAFDPLIISFIDDEIMDQSSAVRLVYAWRDGIGNPEILDRMKNDPHRPVIVALAFNPKAWVSTHEYLASTHKSPAVLEGIAMATTDSDLLNSIYCGTKSAQVRRAAEENPVFVRSI